MKDQGIVLDLQREQRLGFDEAIYCAGKSVQQVEATALLDAEVTPARVLAAVRAAARATTADDMMVIFYSGHGLDGRARGQADAGLVLTTPKTRMADLKSTALPWAALADALSEARGTIVVVLDACHAGIAGSDDLSVGPDGHGECLRQRSGGTDGDDHDPEAAGGGPRGCGNRQRDPERCQHPQRHTERIETTRLRSTR